METARGKRGDQATGKDAGHRQFEAAIEKPIGSTRYDCLQQRSDRQEWQAAADQPKGLPGEAGQFVQA